MTTVNQGIGQEDHDDIITGDYRLLGEIGTAA